MENTGQLAKLNHPATPRMLRGAPDSSKGFKGTDSSPNTLNMAPTRPDGHAELLPPAVLSSHEDEFKRGHSSRQPQTPSPKLSQHHQSRNDKQVDTAGMQQRNNIPNNGQPQLQQFHRKSIGDWDFVRTIGAGSMGKVKLARHTETGEKCAVKIVPRAAKLYQRAHANDPPVKSVEEAAQRQKEFDKEIARDKRTIREGALGRLLFHPHICRLYEIVPMTNHYYMLFEYVEGGQLLDYIVSHGSLSEQYARKLARQIASALDYCHKNNVVHRDLKIENIMINVKGEIKIIDFGLSNLYMPNHLLKTYCGSLYFAAPELLSAKPYVGPEVDVWSFGVVLYVLVCGKVPFDDPVVSALHEKIKKGHVEYPLFLSKDCISLLSRMLVVDPTKRATLLEIIQHPWMNLGFDHPTPSYTPERAPLSLPLDPTIVQTISQFDLGSVSFVSDELTKIITSPEYQLGCDNWYKYAQRGQKPPTGSNIVYGFHPLVSIYYLVEEVRKRKRAKEEAIKKQLHEQAHVRVEPPVPSSSNVSTGVGNAIRLSSPHPPPTDNYFPGKLDKTYQSPKPPLAPPQRSHSISTGYSHTEPRPESLVSTPKQPSRHNHQEAQQSTPQTIPRLSYPEPVHTPTMPRSLDKATTPTDLESQYLTQSPLALHNAPETLDPNNGKLLGFNSLFRKLSSKKSRSPVSKGSSPTKPTQIGNTFEEHTVSPSDSPLSSIASSMRDPLVRRGVSMKITAKEKSGGSRVNLQNEQLIKQRDRTQSKYDNKYKGHAHSASTSGKPHSFIPVEYLPPLPSLNPHQMEGNAHVSHAKAAEGTHHGSSDKKFHPTARAKSVGSHAFKDTMKMNRVHPALPESMAAQNSDEGIDEGAPVTSESSTYDDVNLSDVQPVELPTMSEEAIIEQFNHAKRNSMPSIEYPKTLFLKGFFSVQTTSTKPLPVIRYNILRVLSRLGVRFQEVKGGFMCLHSVYTPTKELESEHDDAHYADAIIDDYKLDETSDEKDIGHEFKFSSESESHTPDFEHRSQLTDSHTTSSHHSSEHSKPSLQVVTSPPSSGFVKGHRSSNSTSTTHRRKFSVGQSFLQNYRKKNGSQTLMPPNTPATARLTKLLLGAMDLDDEDLDDETRMQLQQLADDDSVDSLSGIMIGGGSDMLVSSRIEQRAKHHKVSLSSEDDGLPRKKTPLKFEINIVKVPLVGLYGVQFKKTLGNTWSYKTLAGQILKDLNL